MPADALLVYHNAAYPRLKDCRVGTNHHHEVTGDQLHIMALNAAGKQVVSQRPRYYFPACIDSRLAVGRLCWESGQSLALIQILLLVH